jgi:hypothetical protein
VGVRLVSSFPARHRVYSFSAKYLFQVPGTWAQTAAVRLVRGGLALGRGLEKYSTRSCAGYRGDVFLRTQYTGVHNHAEVSLKYRR